MKSKRSKVQFSKKTATHQTRLRVGNGHKSRKTRELTDEERGLILHEFFLKMNGQTLTNSCVVFQKEYISPEVAIFQITGYVTSLHYKVADGRLQVPDKKAYLEWLQSDPKKTMWKIYNSPRNIKARLRNEALIQAGSIGIYTVRRKNSKEITPIISRGFRNARPKTGVSVQKEPWKKVVRAPKLVAFPRKIYRDK